MSAYEKHLAAVERLDAIKRSLDGDAAASGSAKLLSEAERLLQGASKETKRCADLEAELKRNNKV